MQNTINAKKWCCNYNTTWKLPEWRHSYLQTEGRAKHEIHVSFCISALHTEVLSNDLTHDFTCGCLKRYFRNNQSISHLKPSQPGEHISFSVTFTHLDIFSTSLYKTECITYFTSWRSLTTWRALLTRGTSWALCSFAATWSRGTLIKKKHQNTITNHSSYCNNFKNIEP